MTKNVTRRDYEKIDDSSSRRLVSRIKNNTLKGELLDYAKDVLAMRRRAEDRKKGRKKLDYASPNHPVKVGDKVKFKVAPNASRNANHKITGVVIKRWTSELDTHWALIQKGQHRYYKRADKCTIV